MGQTFFFYGTLCHLPLLRAVLGRTPQATPADLPGHRVAWAQGQDFPLIEAAHGRTAPGLLVEGLTAEDQARLDFYEGGFAYRTRVLPVPVAGRGDVSAQVYFPDPGHWQAGVDWRLADWAAIWGETVTASAADVMALYGQKPAQAVAARRHAMLVRAGSRVRAASDPAPTDLRHSARPDDVQVDARREPYAHFFAVEEYDLRFRRFDGALSAPATRAAFVSGDAVTVLPYDPVRDRVLLVEQFRAGPFARGDRQPWQLEAVAGRVDPAESPENAARREAVEEAGVVLRDLLPVANYYPSPGAKTEFILSYVGLADLPDSAARLGGLADEGEDIRGHVIPFARLMDLVATGEIANAPLILSALWLDRERPRLRTASAASSL